MSAMWFFFLPVSGENEFEDTFPGLSQLINPDDWGTVEFTLEVQGKTDTPLKPLVARLYDITSGAAVAGSGVTISTTAVDRQRSAAFSLASADREYKVQHGTKSPATATAYKADVIVTPT